MNFWWQKPQYVINSDTSLYSFSPAFSKLCFNELGGEEKGGD